MQISHSSDREMLEHQYAQARREAKALYDRDKDNIISDDTKISPKARLVMDGSTGHKPDGRISVDEFVEMSMSGSVMYDKTMKMIRLYDEIHFPEHSEKAFKLDGRVTGCQI